MNFSFSEEQKMLRKTVRGFVDKEIMPHIGAWDRAGKSDPAIYNKACRSWINGCLYSRRIWWKRHGL